MNVTLERMSGIAPSASLQSAMSGSSPYRCASHVILERVVREAFLEASMSEESFGGGREFTKLEVKIWTATITESLKCIVRVDQLERARQSVELISRIGI